MGKTIGYLALEDKEPYATFQYDDEFIKYKLKYLQSWCHSLIESISLKS